MGKNNNGWMGKYLSVDLTEGEVTIKASDHLTLDEYLGGNGIGTKIVYDEVTPDIPAFDSKNILVFAAGNLAGTKAFSSGLITATSKSPIGDNMIASSQANGFFGSRLKFAGFDYIVIRGRAPKLVYLKITDSHGELVEAEDLRGMDIHQAGAKMKSSFESKKVSTAVIGKPGELKSLLSGIMVDDGHIIASGALGAVMGDKNLKGIAVSGTQDVGVSDPNALDDLVKEWVGEIGKSPLVGFLKQAGTVGTVGSSHELGDVITKNGTTSIAEHEDLSSLSYRSRHKVKVEACYRCPLNHCKQITLMQGPGQGIVMDEPEFEGAVSMGANIGVSDGDIMLYLHSIVDKHGLDVRKLGSIIALLMECFEEGMITEEALDGLNMSWGNYESVVKIINKIVNREGIGDILAEGIIETAKFIGGDAIDRALYGKNGAAYHTHDLRAYFGYGLGHVITSYIGTKEGVGTDMVADSFITEKQLHPHSPEMKGFTVNATADKEGVCDLIGLCHFVVIYDIKPETIAKVFNAVTGSDYTYYDLMKAAKRNRVLARAFACRHGMTTDDDKVAKRFYELPNDGPNVQADFAKHIDQMKKEYYKEAGYDPISGKPLPETLKSLGLDYVLEDLWSE